MEIARSAKIADTFRRQTHSRPPLPSGIVPKGFTPITSKSLARLNRPAGRDRFFLRFQALRAWLLSLVPPDFANATSGKPGQKPQLPHIKLTQRGFQPVHFDEKIHHGDTARLSASLKLPPPPKLWRTTLRTGRRASVVSLRREPKTLKPIRLPGGWTGETPILHCQI